MIRPARPDDIPTLAEFQIRMAWETESKRLELDTVRAGITAVLDDPAKGFYRVAERDGRLVGALMITREWSDWRNRFAWYIQSVYVVPEARTQGVFRRLYQHVLDMATEHGVHQVRLYVEKSNDPAQRAYRRLGMTPLPYEMFEVDVETITSTRNP